MDKYILPKNQAITVFLVFAIGYLLSCLLRAITATLSPVFTSEFDLMAADLGLLAGGYFFGFACMQIPYCCTRNLSQDEKNEWPHRTLHLEPGKCLKNEEELLLACGDWKSANGYTTGYRLFFSLGGRKPKACLLSLQFPVFLTLKWALNWFISAVILGSQKLCLFILQFITLLVF